MTEFTLHIASLITKHFRDDLNNAEAEELKQYLESWPEAQQMFNEVNEAGYISKTLKAWSDHDYSALTAKIAISYPRINEPAGQPAHPSNRTIHRVQFLKTAWFRWAAAIIILFGISTYIVTQTSEPAKEVVLDQPSPKSNDVLPGSNKALLTLSNGKNITLDSADSETIRDGSLAIQNQNGRIIYNDPKNNNLFNPRSNKMSTPRGGQYQLTLSDGTRVWLNAESSITFPVLFTEKTREVSITGEAYFEIEKNKSKPFIVHTQKESITVLGTNFNVHAYNEQPVKTSLFQGSIKVNNVIIHPGQAVVNGRITSTDLEQDLAWKNGLFNFNELAVEQALQQLARWYDIEIKYTGKIPNMTLLGEMGRQLTLQQVLESLKILGLKAELNNRILKIYP